MGLGSWDEFNRLVEIVVILVIYCFSFLGR